MVTKNDENRKRIVQVEVKRLEYSPMGLGRRITFYKTRSPIEKLRVYFPEEEIKSQVDFRA
ncbi:MAG: hypothetical protein Q8N63_06960 [Nanoarchaeota archaeon]|nr:hypothetical protein [Nanoarchaeota archaeon]